MLFPTTLFGGFWISRFPMPRDEMRNICEYSNDLWTEKLVPTYAIFAFDVAKDCVHTFRVETCTNIVFDVKWSANVEDGQDGNEYKIQVYKCLRDWFEEQEHESLGVDFKNPTEYFLWKGRGAL